MLVCARVTRTSRRSAHASQHLCGTVIFFSISLSLSLFISENPHKHLRQQEHPDCKPKRLSILYKHKSPDSSSLAKDPGGPVRPTRRHGFPQHRLLLSSSSICLLTYPFLPFILILLSSLVKWKLLALRNTNLFSRSSNE